MSSIPESVAAGSETVLVRQAVILAGGQASRLRPYTDRLPKVLVEVAGRPILQHQAHWLAAEGIQEVVVSCGYLAEVLKAYVAANRLPLRVCIAVEDQPLGRGGGRKHAARQLPYPEERWVGLNGDIPTRFSLRDLASRHVERCASATVAVTPLKSPYGVVELAPGGRPLGSERPSSTSARARCADAVACKKCGAAVALGPFLDSTWGAGESADIRRT